MSSSKGGGTAPVYPIHHIPPHKRKFTSREAVRERMSQELQSREQEKRDDLNRERQAYIDSHTMVRGHEPKSVGNSTIDNLNQIKYRLVREAAAMEFTRFDRDRRGLDTSDNSKMIVSTWKQVAAIELDIKKQGVQVLDPNSEEVQRIFKVWVESMKETMLEMIKDETISRAAVDLFFNKFSSAIEGWESRIG